jgi:hypothetical protein
LTECIGKGNASAPYEFGVKVSIVTTNSRPGRPVRAHTRALPGNPYDGYTLRDVIDQTQKLTGAKSSAPMSTRATRTRCAKSTPHLLPPYPRLAEGSFAPSALLRGYLPISAQSGLLTVDYLWLRL